MWPLRWFRYDEAINSPEVYLQDGPGGSVLMSREQALDIARSRGEHLILEWPEQTTTGPALCWIGPVSLPVRWEEVSDTEPSQDRDPLLWFEAPCGGRDLLTGNGGTFPGRMSAWCPDKQVSYNVSLAEMGEMSEQARYYVAGFLAGNQPGPPPAPDPDSDIAPADLAAWQSATARFRRTGSWYGRWRTCHTCGRVLFPDSDGDQCHGHRPGPPS